MTRQTLTTADVERLISNPSADVRAETAKKVADQFGEGALSDDERQLAEDICRVMLDDAEVRVREALSATLKHSKDLPHDMARKMALDVDTVALPVLKFSEVLTDEDLMEIISSDAGGKQVAIAGRETVNPEVADALVERGDEEVVAELLANEGAEIAEKTYGTVLEKFADSDRVKTPMAHRTQLPVAIAERLVKIVSDRLQEHICTHHELSPDVAGDLIMRSRERATMSLSAEDSAQELVESLAKNGRLTPSIVARAVCMGDMPFFEWSMATLSMLPIGNTRTLIHDRGNLGLAAVFDRTSMPKALYPVIRAAVDIGRETEDGAGEDHDHFVKQMIERVVTKFEDPGLNIDPDTLDYLLRRMEAISDGSRADGAAA